mgnify:CR=1 FL=1
MVNHHVVNVISVMNLCEREGYEYTYKTLDEDYTREDLMDLFPTARTFPQIIAEGDAIGGYDQLWSWHLKESTDV